MVESTKTLYDSLPQPLWNQYRNEKFVFQAITGKLAVEEAVEMVHRADTLRKVCGDLLWEVKESDAVTRFLNGTGTQA
jgi:hypothetical protein